MSLTGERIRELRLSLGLTLDDVARHLGVGRQAIYKYEQGTVTNIPLENIEKMAALFGVTPGYLTGWKDNTPEGHAIVIPDSDMFRKIMEHMSYEDYQLVMDAFDRTYKIMKEKGLLEEEPK